MLPDDTAVVSAAEKLSAAIPVVIRVGGQVDVIDQAGCVVGRLEPGKLERYVPGDQRLSLTTAGDVADPTPAGAR